MSKSPRIRPSRAPATAVAVFAVLALIAPGVAHGCRIDWRPHEEVEADADLVVEAVVVHAGAPRKSFASWEYDYRIRIESVRRGRVKKEQLEVTYDDAKAHHRGDMVICPIKHGTGIENQLEVGKRYELFLESGDDPELLLARELNTESEDEADAKDAP